MSKLRQLLSRASTWLGHLFDEKPLDPEIVDVANFQRKFGHLLNTTPTHLTKRKLYERLDCMHEELNEFENAIITQDMLGQLDALIDLVYFAKGTATMLGLGDLWVQAWLEVQRANMDKVPGIGKRGHRVDVVKPADWVPPRHEEILREAGYCREDWLENGVVFEGYCSDDEVHRG